VISISRIIGLILIFLLSLSFPATANEQYQEVGLIVVGSDPEGIAAAVAGSRQGLETILVCHKDRVGGLFTRGGLNTLDMNYGPNRELLTRGLFEEFFEQIEGSSFDVETAERVFLEMLAEAEVKVILNAEDVSPVIGTTLNKLTADKRVIGIQFVHNGENHEFRASTTVDATQDADIAFAAGAAFTWGMEDFGGPSFGMGATLIFGVENVDWNMITRGIRQANYPNTGYDTRSVWGFWSEMQDYQPRDEAIRFRGLNIGRQDGDTVLINAMYIFNFDHLCPEGREQAIIRGEEELETLIPFLRERIPGFENASLNFVGDELYIRETRHLIGLYRLTIDDVLEHRDFWDKIALGSYPVDIQDMSLQARGFVLGDPRVYSIPFRCLVPERIDGILVASRSASYDSLAHGSSRVVPVGMNVGEAAGVASALSKQYGNTPWQELAKESHFIAHLQTVLLEEGAHLPYFKVPHALEGHWAYPQIKLIRSLGMIAAGYDNNYRLEEKISPEGLQNLFNNGLRRYYKDRDFNYFYTRARDRVTGSDIAALMLAPLNIRSDNPIEKAQQMGLIPTYMPTEAELEGPINRATLYYLLGEYFPAVEEYL